MFVLREPVQPDDQRILLARVVAGRKVDVHVPAGAEGRRPQAAVHAVIVGVVVDMAGKLPVGPVELATLKKMLSPYRRRHTTRQQHHHPQMSLHDPAPEVRPEFPGLPALPPSAAQGADSTRNGPVAGTARRILPILPIGPW